MKKKDRADWLYRMLQIAEPVIVNLAGDRLKETMPTIFHPDRELYMHLEALGRTVMGIAPWLELEEVPEDEKELQEKFRQLVRRGLANAVNPDAKDYMNFSEGYGQALVDAAFLAQDIVRAPKQMYLLLSERDKKLMTVLLSINPFLNLRKFLLFKERYFEK